MALSAIYVKGTLPVYRCRQEVYRDIINGYKGEVIEKEEDKGIDLSITCGFPKEISHLRDKGLVNFEPPMYFHISREGVELVNQKLEEGEETELF